MLSFESTVIGMNGREVVDMLYCGNWLQSESDDSVGEGESVKGEGEGIDGENVVGESGNIVSSLFTRQKSN